MIELASSARMSLVSSAVRPSDGTGGATWATPPPKFVTITRAAHQALVTAGTVDANTFYFLT